MDVSTSASKKLELHGNSPRIVRRPHLGFFETKRGTWSLVRGGSHKEAPRRRNTTSIGMPPLELKCWALTQNLIHVILLGKIITVSEIGSNHPPFI
jgi:hypothetical protein